MIAKKRQKNHYFQPRIFLIPIDRQSSIVTKVKGDGRENHEKDALATLSRFGYPIKLIKPKGQKGESTADLYWLGEIWELKSIFGDKSESVYRQMKEASKKSQNIIIDILHTRRTIAQVASDVNYYIEERSRGVSRKKVIIIGKNEYCIVRGDMVL